MSFLNRFFGKKPTPMQSVAAEQIQQQEGKLEINEPDVTQESNVVSGHHKLEDKGPESKDEKQGVAKSEQAKQSKAQPEHEVTASEVKTPWRTFPIFISSTFADMQAERDHLKNIVFPLVEEELQKRRIKLEIVDLRWGVDTTSMAQEDEREANVLKVCLDEIRRCRPFFIGLLGDRYGWVPPLERMKTALVGEKHITPEKGKSVTDLEIEFGVLASQEQLVRSVFYFREPLPYETFSKKKAAMFSDEYNNELSGAEKKERKSALEKLKTNIINHFSAKKLENKVKTYNGTWNAEKEKLTGLETWGDIVYTDILAECENHAKDTWDKVPQNWQEQELALLDAFIETNTTTFCGRKPLLENLKQHLLTDNTSNWGLVLTGESGSGKSAVFSMVTKMMQERKDCFILAHSAGLSPRAKSVADLLRIWNKQLADRLGIEEESTDETKSADDLTSRLTGEQRKETTTPIEKLQEKFLELLQMASAKKHVVLLIDALDRFEPTARAQHLSWLPSVMPQNVRVLCTAITSTEKNAVQYHKGLKAKSIDVFSTADAKEMLDALCLRQHKSLPAKIEKIILDKKRADSQSATASPLWLSLAVNMLMAIDHDDFEKMSQLEGRGDQQIESYMVAMANGFDPLPGPLFLSLKSKAGLLFGDSFTAAVFNYLAISRNGLREKDLEKILPATNIAWDPLKFANLRRWFKAHLVLQGEELQWSLAHSILRSALTEQVEETQRKKLHNALASYLMPLHNDLLKATETIYHLINAGNYKEAALYYSSDLTDEEEAGATNVLAEIVTADEKGLILVSTLPGLVVNEFESFHRILKRFIYELHDALKVEGNLSERLILLEKIKIDLEKVYEDNITDEGFRYDVAVSYLKLGDINGSIGHMEEAINYFVKNLKLVEELLDNNPSYKLLTNWLIPFIKLGDLHLAMGHTKDALYYFELHKMVSKKIFDDYPQIGRSKIHLGIAYFNLAEVHRAMGHLEKAINYFELFIEFGKELLKANPRSDERKINLAVSYGRLGRIHLDMGHMKDALTHFELSNKLSKECYEANPKYEKLKNSLAISYQDLGEIHQEMGQMDIALNYFEESRKLSEEIYETNPLDEPLKNNLAISYMKLGTIHQKLGHFEKTVNCFERSLKLNEELNDNKQLNESIKDNLATSYSKLGEIHESMGLIDKALNYFEMDLKLTEEIYDANPLNKSIKKNLAISYEKLGGIYHAKGLMKEALNYFEKDFQLSQELYDSTPHDESLKRGLAISYSKLGDIHQSMGHMEEALKYFETYNKLGEELYNANPLKVDLKSGLAISYYKLGDIHRSIGCIDEALHYFEICIKLEKENYEANPQNESIKEGLAIYYEKLGEIYHVKGLMKEALNYYEKHKKLIKDLYEANPLKESVKYRLAFSFQKLSYIHAEMDQMEEAISSFIKHSILLKELFDNDPGNINLQEGLCMSYYALSMLYKEVGKSKESKDRFANWKDSISILVQSMPKVSKYKEWDRIEYDSPEQSSDTQSLEMRDNTFEQENPVSTNNEKQNSIKKLIQKCEYQKALQILIADENELRNTNNKAFEFQFNIGDQAYILSKMGRYIESLEKYELQSEICARNRMYEDYCDCLLSQSELLIEYMDMPKRAKNLLHEAILVAQNNNLNHIVCEAEEMLKNLI